MAEKFFSERGLIVQREGSYSKAGSYMPNNSIHI